MMRLLHAPGKIPLFSEMVLIAVLAWMVSGWLLPAHAPTLSSLPPKAVSPANTLPNLTRLVAIPLFGKIKAQIQPVNPVLQAPKAVVPSTLNIKLLGTVVAEEHAAAIIAMAAGNEQHVFFIGDSIQPGVILKTVETEAIVIERGGKLERVSLEQDAQLTSSPLPKTNAIASPKRTPAPVIQKNMNRNRLQKQLQDFPALLSQARVIPRMVNGKPNGFTISGIAPGSLYQQVGLQNGDIILSVNGNRITDAKQAMSMYQALQSAASIDLELMRAGQIRQIHYDIH